MAVRSSPTQARFSRFGRQREASRRPDGTWTSPDLHPIGSAGRATGLVYQFLAFNEHHGTRSNGTSPTSSGTTFVHGGAHSHAVDGRSARTSAVLHARLTSQDATYVQSKGSERKACFVFLLGGGTARLTDACVCTCARACLYVDRNDAPGSTDDRGRMQLDAGRCERVRKALQTAKSRRS